MSRTVGLKGNGTPRCVKLMALRLPVQAPCVRPTACFATSSTGTPSSSAACASYSHTRTRTTVGGALRHKRFGDFAAGRDAVTGWGLRCATEVAGGCASETEPKDVQALVDEVLQAIQDTDRGVEIGEKARAEVDGKLRELQSISTSRGDTPLEDARIFGNYNVDYVSSGNKQDGPPAGGRYRTGLGRLLFRTVNVAQSILEPDIVTNKVEFKILGCIPGAVGLRGTFVQKEDDVVPNLAEVKFLPPVVSLPGGLHLNVGPRTIVGLGTQYLDDRVRLGLGKRGSLFVFTRGGASDEIGMDKVGLETSSAIAKIGWSGILLGLLAGSAGLVAWQPLPLKIFGALVSLLVLGIVFVIVRGTLVDNDEW